MSLLHLLDTDTASYLIKSRTPQVEKKLAATPPSMVCISVVTQAELLYGLKALPPAHRLHAGVRQFLKIVRILPWDSAVAEFYADIRHQLVATGQTVTNGQHFGEMDMMIAAQALAVSAVLVTNNTRHFKRIRAPLALVNWVE